MGSTLLLAAIAGACWAAVCWQERSRETVAMTDGQESLERVGDGDAIDDTTGSVTR